VWRTNKTRRAFRVRPNQSRSLIITTERDQFFKNVTLNQDRNVCLDTAQTNAQRYDATKKSFDVQRKRIQIHNIASDTREKYQRAYLTNETSKNDESTSRRSHRYDQFGRGGTSNENTCVEHSHATIDERKRQETHTTTLEQELENKSYFANERCRIGRRRR
jgi:hypothetical protein